MHLGFSILRLLIAIAGVAVTFVVMGYIGDFSAWAFSLRWQYSVPIFIVFGSTGMAIAIWMEKREQKRTGIKKPLFRWNND